VGRFAHGNCGGSLAHRYGRASEPAVQNARSEGRVRQDGFEKWRAGYISCGYSVLLAGQRCFLIKLTNSARLGSEVNRGGADRAASRYFGGGFNPNSRHQIKGRGAGSIMVSQRHDRQQQQSLVEDMLWQLVKVGQVSCGFCDMCLHTRGLQRQPKNPVTASQRSFPSEIPAS